MPPTLTYPGVYIVEVPSSVHTITGVATSIAAFFGQATMGKINKPIEVQSLADFTRNFGAPVSGGFLAQSVRQFFDNGGSDCFVVRLANGAHAAALTLNDLHGTPVLKISAASEGVWGNGLLLTVDYATPSPESTFNLQVSYVSQGNVVQTESFANLSMDPAASRYAPTFISQSSSLVVAEAVAAAPAVTTGYSQSRRPLQPPDGDHLGQSIGGILPGSTGSFRISVDGSPWAQVDLDQGTLNGFQNPGDLANFTNYLLAQIRNALGTSSGYDVTVQVDNAGPNFFLRLVSNGPTKSSVLVRRASTNDIATVLMMGVDQGGIEVTSFSDLRPVPTGISFTGDATTEEVVAAMDALSQATADNVSKVTLGGTDLAINLGTAGTDFWAGTTPGDFDGIRERLQMMANQINAGFPAWNARVAGYRLSLQKLRPASPQENTAFSVTAAGNAATFAGLFTSNVAQYQLGNTSGTFASVPAGGVGNDGNPPGPNDYIGDESSRTGFWALENVDLFNLMVIPGDGLASETDWQSVRSNAAIYCQNRRAFLILDAPVVWASNRLLNTDASHVADFRSQLGSATNNAAVFYPRVQFNDQGTLRWMGPSGMLAGIMARTDASRGVWKAPAGNDAQLNGAADLEVILTDKQNGILNPMGVNAIRRMASGFVNWGARTVAGFDNAPDDEWRYIPVRRMALFLEESLYRGTQWVVFEPNDEPLWAQIRLNIGAFMNSLFRQGAFKGKTPAEAYLVKCDKETTTPDDVNRGVVNIVVGFAPLKPAEFVVIQIQQIAQAVA